MLIINSTAKASCHPSTGPQLQELRELLRTQIYLLTPYPLNYHINLAALENVMEKEFSLGLHVQTLNALLSEPYGPGDTLKWEGPPGRAVPQMAHNVNKTASQATDANHLTPFTNGVSRPKIKRPQENEETFQGGIAGGHDC